MTLAERLQRDWWRHDPTPLARSLKPLSAVYAALVGTRNTAYRTGLLSSRTPALPVVVVGNLVVGGAGKTPTVIALVAALRQLGWHPGIVSRGYGRSSDALAAVHPHSLPTEVGDEPLLMHLRTQAPVMVGRDRVAAVRALREAHPDVDIVVSDDGLQHRRLARVLQVIVFDDRGVGNGSLLPAGPLRERLPAEVPDHSVVLYNAAAPSTPLPGAVATRRLAGAVPLADWWHGAAPSASTLHALRGRAALACAGMAHPERFFAMLEHEGLRFDRLPLPDHFDFSRLPWPASAQDVLVTEKDAVKLRPDSVGGARVWVVALDLRLPEAFIAEVQRLLPARPPPP